ncbi:hypothetical protein niasHS_014487 [Heterodera schachtii]|uniref:Gamma-sarcoglycan n=1 Tax=Heterodera schachtii TaxID=97005 RepID=A0ABD2I8R8_HETSC
MSLSPFHRHHNNHYNNTNSSSKQPHHQPSSTVAAATALQPHHPFSQHHHHQQHHFHDDEEPIWTCADTFDSSLHRSPPPPLGYQPPAVHGETAQAFPTTVVHASAKSTTPRDIYRVGIYGWRKRCLYAFILLLTLVVFINLAFTFWIMAVLDFSLNGIGALKIEEDRIRVLGRSEFEKPVQFSQLSSTEALSIDSARGVSINAHNASGQNTASLNLQADGRANVMCERFEVVDRQMNVLFSVDSQEIGLNLENLRILDDGGSIFEGAIQTSIVRPEPDSPLSLESPTRDLVVEAGRDIELMSKAGEIQINSIFDINLKARQGEIRLDSSDIFISGLETSTGLGSAQYQLCVCLNGRLFLATVKADCRADRSIC